MRLRLLYLLGFALAAGCSGWRVTPYVVFPGRAAGAVEVEAPRLKAPNQEKAAPAGAGAASLSGHAG